MAIATTIKKFKKEIHWTPFLIKKLRGKRTQAEFGELIGAPKNTVWRWEAGQSCPDSHYLARLFDIATREHFFLNWKLAGSMALSGNLVTARSEITAIFRKALERSVLQLME